MEIKSYRNSEPRIFLVVSKKSLLRFGSTRNLMGCLGKPAGRKIGGAEPRQMKEAPGQTGGRWRGPQLGLGASVRTNSTDVRGARGPWREKGALETGEHGRTSQATQNSEGVEMNFSFPSGPRLATEPFWPGISYCTDIWTLTFLTLYFIFTP